MSKPVNERPADEFGNHNADLESLDYTDEKVEKAKKASELGKKIGELYKNTLIVASDAKATDMNGGFGTGLMQCYFGGASSQKEQQLMLEQWLTAIVENFIKAGMFPKPNVNSHQQAYNFFAKLAGYYAWEFEDVEDTFNVLDGMDVDSDALEKELKKHGISLKDYDLKSVGGFNASQLQALMRISGVDPVKSMKQMKEKGMAVVKLDLDSLTKGQKADLETLLGVNLEREARKNERRKKMKSSDNNKGEEGKTAVNFIQANFKPRYIGDGIIANDQGVDDLIAFLTDEENLDNQIFEQMWDDDDEWKGDGLFADLGLERDDDDDFNMAKRLWIHGRSRAGNDVSVYFDILLEEMEEKEKGKNE